MQDAQEDGGGGYYGGASGYTYGGRSIFAKSGTSYVDTNYFTDISKSVNTKEGNGYVSITLLTSYPDVALSANTTELTNQDVIISADASDEKSGLAEEAYSWNSGERTSSNSFVATQNGTYTVNVINNEGNSTDASITINNIDKQKPTINSIEQVVATDFSESTLTIDAVDEQNSQYASSGIAGYALTNSKEVPTEFYDTNVFKVTENGTYYAWAKDNVGNISLAKQVSVIDLQIEIIGNISWNDENNKYNTRKSKTLSLYGKVEGEKEVLIDSINLSDTEDTYKFKTRQRDASGNVYNFRIEQTTLDGYETTYIQKEVNTKSMTIDVENNLILPDYASSIYIIPLNSYQDKMLKNSEVKIVAKITASEQNYESTGIHGGQATMEVDSKIQLDKNNINIIYEDIDGNKTIIDDYSITKNTITTYVGTNAKGISLAGGKLTIETYGVVKDIGEYINNITFTGKLVDYRGKNTNIDLGIVTQNKISNNVEYQIPKANIKLKKVDSITEEILTDATFTLYEWNGTQYIKKETIRDENKDGIYESEVYSWTPETQGKYKIVEEGIPTYHKDSNFFMEYSLVDLKNEDYTISVDYDNKGYVIKYGQWEPDDLNYINGVVENEPFKLNVQIEKVDEETQNIIQKDAEFTIYEWNNETNQYQEYISYITGEKVNMVRQEDKTYLSGEWIYYTTRNEGKYRIIETRVPEGYVANYNENNEVQVYDIDVLDIIQAGKYNNQAVENGGILKLGNNASNKMTNKRVKANLNIKVVDAETKGKPQAEATLKGAKYELYASEDILHSDGKTTNYEEEQGLLYKKDELIKILYTDENGNILVENLECGKYYIKMIEPPKGYNLDEASYELDCSYQGIDKEVLNINKTIEIKVKKQSFQLYKLKESQDVLKNAGFSIFLIQDLSIVKENKIEKVTKDTYILNDEQAKVSELLKGKQNSDGTYFLTDLIEYYYGIYYTEDSKDTLPGNEEVYHPYNLENEQLVLDYSNTELGTHIEEIMTDNKGYLKSPELAYGEYIVIETSVPREQQVASSFIVKIEEDNREAQQLKFVTDNDFKTRVKIYVKDAETNEVIKNKETYFAIKRVDTDEYITINQWNGIEFVKYGTPENPFKVGAEGYIITPTKLPIGKYILEEVKAPEGYVVNGKEGYEQNGQIVYTPERKVIFEIKSNTAYYMDASLGNFVIVVSQENEQVLGNISVETKGEYLNNVQVGEKYEFEYEQRAVENIEYTLFAQENIYKQYDNKQIEYEKGQIVDIVTTNGEGKGKFENIPQGKYYIKQTATINGFALKEQTKNIEVTYEGQEIPVVFREFETEEQRQILDIVIRNIDKETKENVSGGEYALYTKEAINYKKSNGEESVIEPNTIIAKVQANEYGEITFKEMDLPLANYYIAEITSPYGYLKTTENIDIIIPFTQESKIKVEKFQEKDKTPTKVNIAFEYKGNKVDGVTFSIKSKDGNIIATTEEIEGTKKIEHIENGYYIENLTVGEYILTQEEVLYKEGFVKNEDTDIKIQDTSEKQEIIIEQEVSKLLIKIEDEETQQILKNVDIKILDKDSNVIASTEQLENAKKIDETEQGYYVEKLPLNEYKIKVEKDGYKQIEERLIIKDENNIQEQNMVIQRLKFNVSIDKKLKEIISNGVSMQIDTDDMMKLEIKERNLETAQIILNYEILIKNTGETQATIQQINDIIPKGLTYISGQNWNVKNSIATYEKTEVLQPGESKKLTMTLKWDNNKNNFGEKKNIVEIVKCTNPYNYNETNLKDNKATESTIISIATGKDEQTTVLRIIIITLVSCMVICLMAGIEILFLEKIKRN